MSLKDITCAITETASNTKRPPVIARTISCLVIIPTAPNDPPKAKDPVSPIKIFAGGALNHKKPRQDPIIAPQKMDASPSIYDKIKLTTLMPPNKVVAAPAETVDLVVTFRNIHNWVNNGIEKAVLTSAYKALKKNGVLGLVAHRTKDSSVGLESAQTGYLTEDQVIAIVEEVGFRLEARSEINANPSDSANHPKGVWTLPPMLRLGEIDKEKYLAIGESDRMTLKFIKK